MRLSENGQIFGIFGLFKPKMTFWLIFNKKCLIWGFYGVPKNGQKALYTAREQNFLPDLESKLYKVSFM